MQIQAIKNEFKEIEIQQQKKEEKKREGSKLKLNSDKNEKRIDTRLAQRSYSEGAVVPNYDDPPTKISLTYASKPLSDEDAALKQFLDEQNFKLVFRTFLTSVKYPGSEVLEPIVRWRLKPIISKELVLLSGPEDSSAEDCSYGAYASGAAVSTYPSCPGRPYREGDPVCDRFQISLMENAAFIVLTDGCNWGDKPRKASRIANRAILNYLKANSSEYNTVSDVIYSLIAALAEAHLAILDNPEEVFSGATTTAFVGTVLEVDQEWVESHVIQEIGDSNLDVTKTLAPTRWIFVGSNIGDCKVLHFSQRTRKVVDITDTCRMNALDPTDPGGRLGSYKHYMPDFRNLVAVWMPVEEGDIIFAMSDGVHDNLDPQILGLSPVDFAQDYTWSNIPDYLASALKRFYLVRFVEEKIVGACTDVTPDYIKNRLVEHCVRTTQATRNFLSSNPAAKTPGGYKDFPGKLDHTSVACVRVGPLYKHGTQIVTQIPQPQIVKRHRPTRLERSTTVTRADMVIEGVKNDMEKLKSSLDPDWLEQVSEPLTAEAKRMSVPNFQALRSNTICEPHPPSLATLRESSSSDSKKNSSSDRVRRRLHGWTDSLKKSKRKDGTL